jgi:hypothetical protein
MCAYEKSTRPLMDYYASRGHFVPVLASGAPEEILKRSLGLLNERLAESGVKEGGK